MKWTIGVACALITVASCLAVARTDSLPGEPATEEDLASAIGAQIPQIEATCDAACTIDPEGEPCTAAASCGTVAAVAPWTGASCVTDGNPDGNCIGGWVYNCVEHEAHKGVGCLTFEGECCTGIWHCDGSQDEPQSIGPGTGSEFPKNCAGIGSTL